MEASNAGMIRRRGAVILRRIENLKELCQHRPKIEAVLPGTGLKEVEQDVARLEHTGVVGEQTEDDSDQESLKIVTSVSGVGERIVQPSNQFGGLDVDGVLIAESPAFHAEDEAERLYMRGQVREGKGDDLSLVEIVKFEVLEIADEDVARSVALTGL